LRRFSLPDGRLRFSKIIWPLIKVILVSSGFFNLPVAMMRLFYSNPNRIPYQTAIYFLSICGAFHSLIVVCASQKLFGPRPRSFWSCPTGLFQSAGSDDEAFLF
jgi:hypothetical protein